jgi:hypothetical protein
MGWDVAVNVGDGIVDVTGTDVFELLFPLDEADAAVKGELHPARKNTAIEMTAHRLGQVFSIDKPPKIDASTNVNLSSGAMILKYTLQRMSFNF